MTSRPILFSAPMVRALLAGTKTQTRRVAKLTAGARVKAVGSPRNWHPDDPNAVAACPYGQPGDRLWVKETHRFDGLDPEIAIANRDADAVQFRADEDDEFVTWRPSIFMPRWASRLTLEITEVRIERLNAITEADAAAEGLVYNSGRLGPWSVDGQFEHLTAVETYRALWQDINGPGSWALNPYVWALTFRRVTP